MHVFGIGLHLLIAICCAVHALRSGQERYWLFILFMFPLLGSLVYAIAILLPELSRSRGARRAVRGLRHAIDPSRELRAAQGAYSDSPTVENILRLADALTESGQARQAVPFYQSALTGIYAQDPKIEVRLARALLDSGHAQQARELLEALIARAPEFRSPEGHLTYARSLAAVGERELARQEFNTLVGYFAGLQARAVYAEQLHDWGEQLAAKEVREEGLRLAQRMPRYARDMNKPWIERLQGLTV